MTYEAAVSNISDSQQAGVSSPVIVIKPDDRSNTLLVGSVC